MIFDDDIADCYPSPAELAGVAVCRACGCSELEACEGGCIWVEPDLCSRCVREGLADDA